MEGLTSQEFRRLIIRMGGLWTASDLARLFGRSARLWVQDDSFPSAAWEAGTSQLYPGLEVWHWLNNKGQVSRAEQLKAKIESMDRRKFEEA
jgi:hypothetical protein